jgi:hypothetical protein
VWEVLRSPFHRRAPFWRGGLAHGVLIAEETDFVDCSFDGDRLKPLDSDEIFTAVRVVCKFPVIIAPFEDR